MKKTVEKRLTAIQKYLLDNTHVAVVVVAPEKGLTAKLEAETAKKLADFKAGLSEEQVKELVEKTAKLQEFQETPSTQEELEKIPMLTRGISQRNADRSATESFLLATPKFCGMM